LLIAPRCLGNSYEFQDDFYSDYLDNSLGVEQQESAPPPIFLSPPTEVTVNEGGTLRLPCRVDSLQGFVLLWKRGERILAIGDSIKIEVWGFGLGVRRLLINKDV
jgi:hypothetical protein